MKTPEDRARAFIDYKYSRMVMNWSNQAELLSYDQVAKLMVEFHEKELNYEK